MKRRPLTLPHLVVAVSCFAACGCDSASEKQGIFTDLSQQAKLPPRQPYPAGSLHVPEAMSGGVAVLDYDNDGDLDIYQVVHAPPRKPFSAQLRDPAPNRLYRQETDGTFAEAAGAAGVAVADVDSNGYLDLYITNFGPNRLYLARGDGSFEDKTAQAGLDDDASSPWSSSAAFVDYDQDGDLDLIDRDGDVDIVTTNIDNTLRLYRNDAPGKANHWLRIRALSGKRDALGAAIRVHTGLGVTSAVFVLATSQGYLSCHEPRVHVGLGSVASVRAVDVLWPEGERERFVLPAGTIDREITLRKGAGESREVGAAGGSSSG